jgi:phosphoglycerate dehydrogenase-like enzyme
VKILLCGATEEQFARLRNMFSDIVFESSDDYDFRSGRIDAQALVAWSRRALDAIFSPAMIANCQSLEWVHAPGAGVEDYMRWGLPDAHFEFTSGKIILGVEVADHAVAMLLMLTRSLHHALKGIPFADIPRPVELRGKTAVIIGMGGIGLGLAERLSAFGMTVHGVMEDQVPYVSFVDKRFLSDQLLDALPLADAVIVAAPWTELSENMLDEPALRAMKSDAFLVNVSRGGLIDTEALTRVVADGHLRAVALDVTNPEPLADNHPLRSFNNVVITPHLAGISDNLRDRIFELISTNIRRFSTGRPLINIVDKFKGY